MRPNRNFPHGSVEKNRGSVGFGGSCSTKLTLWGETLRSVAVFGV